jgi:hypothetical protein
MPGYNRAELSAELTIETSPGAPQSPRQQIEALTRAAGDTGLAHESGPGATVLAGGRREVLEGLARVLEASLDAGAHVVRVKVEAQGDAPRFGS